MKPPYQLYLLHALTPLHVGVEDSLGAIDLPTMRERHTGYPLLPGSSVKGVLRSEAESALKAADVNALAAFGPPSNSSGDYRGGLVFTDAQLFALPVRSLAGTFAWVTCPLILKRLNRDLTVIDPRLELPMPVLPEGADHGLVPDSTEEAPSALLAAGLSGQVFLEEILLDVTVSQELGKVANLIGQWLWPGKSVQQENERSFLRRRLLLVNDNLFGFLTRLAMEVRARVRIDSETGTAADSGPWTEEHIPSEALLFGLAMGRRTVHVSYPEPDPKATGPAPEAKKEPRDADQNLAYLRTLVSNKRLLRFGGHGSIGLGRAFFHLIDATTPSSPPKEADQ